MKNLPYFFLAALVLVGGFIAYSRQQTTEPIAATPLQPQQETPDTIQIHRATLHVKDTLVLDKETEEILSKYNLSKLWNIKAETFNFYFPMPDEMEVVEEEELIEPVIRVNDTDSIGVIEADTTEIVHPKATIKKKLPKVDPAIYDGFHGSNRYRIEVYFASVTKDSKRPNIYHVAGKIHFKENVTPFKGKILLTTLHPIQDFSISRKTLKFYQVQQLYASCGSFEFREDSTFAESGVFKGTMAMDFAVHTDKTSRLWFFQKDQTRGAGFLFDGEWTSYKTGKSKPFLLPGWLRALGNQILTDFDIGDRGLTINPKYRKLGWDNYWENDEWWNEPTKPIL